MMRDRPTLTIGLLLVGFTGLVLWASDAFNPWELAAIVAAIGFMVLVALGSAAAASDADNRLEVEAMRRERDAEFDRLVADMFPDMDPDDSSDVRNGGLGR